MSHTPHPTDSEAKPPRRRALIWLNFIQGPWLLLTSRISVKCATLMAALCMPALLYWATLTIPAMLFQSPEQQALFYFSKILNEDPARWFVLLLAAICTITSLAVPAALPAPHSERTA